MNRTILLSDLNSFYASVECLYNPALREKPVAVCGSVEDRHGIVLAANPLAKKFLIKTGDAVWQAKQKCRDLVTVEPHMERYVAMSKAASQIYGDYSPCIEPFGLDENYLDLTGIENGGGEHTAKQIKERIKKELGITASIGVSFTRSFAKLASDMKKPDAVTVIGRDNFKELVWPLPVSELYFVGRATTKKLEWDCIHTIGDLAQANPDRLKRRLGKNGLLIWRNARGEDNDPVALSGWRPEPKSIGNSTTTPKDLIEIPDIRMITMLLSESVAERMRAQALRCRTVQVWLRYNDMASFEHQTVLPFPCCTAQRIGSAALDLILTRRREDIPVRSIGVRVCNLSFDEIRQLSFMPDQEREQKQERLESAMQDIRRRFGHFSIERGMMLCDRRLSGLDTRDKASAQSVAFFRGDRA